jgi:hypothetical protein
VAERLTGIQVEEQPGAEHAITRSATAVTAFIGRTLRGPVDRPVTITSFADFQRVFGGLWQPSTLSYAVEQFFDNGGITAVVLRIANGARPCTLALPAGDDRLLLEARSPGTREFLRAAVDYDGIGSNEDDRFNLVLQRLRSPGSEHIEDQEIYRRLSVRPDSSRHVTAALAESVLAGVAGPVPPCRPDMTARTDGRTFVGYVHSATDGDDGAPLSDYDIIGSAARGTGIFALGGAEVFNFLCIPPLTRDVDVGASTLLVANRYCRDRRAMLVVDPPHDWDTPEAALAGMRDWPFASDSALMYFPRLLAHDRLRGRFESFAPCGAVTGMLARADDSSPEWLTGQADELTLRGGYRPMCTVGDEQRRRLAVVGINTLQTLRPTAHPATVPARTLAGLSAASSDWRLLATRRLALMIISSIERGTRWMLFEPNEQALWIRALRQLTAFFGALEADGAFAGREPGDRWFVICDGRVNREQERDRGVVNVLFGFAATRPGEFHSYLVSHRAGGSRVQSVSLNRLQAEQLRPELVLDAAELPPYATLR